MSTVTFGGAEIATAGKLPALRQQLPGFTLVGKDLADITADDFHGKRLVLNIFPSLDTSTCAMSVRRFNEMVSRWPNTSILCVSQDLPFAQGRFCVVEGIENVVVGSAFRSDFGTTYGVTMTDGPLRGLLARAIVIADEQGKVVYTRLSPVIEEEPDYDEVAAAVLGRTA